MIHQMFRFVRHLSINAATQVIDEDETNVTGEDKIEVDGSVQQGQP